MFGDHHVVEVRRILTEIPGVQEVYASSGFQVIDVAFDDTMTNELEITQKLEDAGYGGEWNLPVEIGAIQEEAEKPFFRHAQVYENTRQVISFSQNVGNSSRSLWPCPGFGTIKTMEGE